MPNVTYDVEVIRQEQNPICWVASCAMVKGYGTQTSIGIGDFTGGFDPSNSCIGNLAGNWGPCLDLMTNYGFSLVSIGGDSSPDGVTADALLAALQGGPAVLLHYCAGFPYGSQWAPLTSGAHAVVLTGIDTDAGTATFNNPWGDKDQPIDLATLVAHMNSDKAMLLARSDARPDFGKTLAFWPPQVAR